ncbi:hypothetical protein M2419_003067 [Sphingobacterium sp. BIGb0116]|nr:hypothetical protein [Sphingobacterium sp. BIGb0116]
METTSVDPLPHKARLQNEPFLIRQESTSYIAIISTKKSKHSRTIVFNMKSNLSKFVLYTL